MRADLRWGIARAVEAFVEAGGAARGMIGLAQAMAVPYAAALRYAPLLEKAGLIEVIEDGVAGVRSRQATVFRASAPLEVSNNLSMSVLATDACTSASSGDHKAVAHFDVSSIPDFGRHLSIRSSRGELNDLGKQVAYATVRIAYFLAGDPRCYGAREDRWRNNGPLGPVVLALTRWHFGHGAFTIGQAADELGQSYERTRLMVNRLLDLGHAKREREGVISLTIRPIVPHFDISQAIGIEVQSLSLTQEDHPLAYAWSEFDWDDSEGELAKAQDDQATARRKQRNEVRARVTKAEAEAERRAKGPVLGWDTRPVRRSPAEIAVERDRHQAFVERLRERGLG